MDGVKVFGWLTLSIYTLSVIVSVTRCYYSKQHFEEEEEKEKEEEQEQEQKEEEEKEKEEEQEQEQEQEEEQEQVKAAASVCWAELGRDLLGEILGRLCLTDQARFRAVCTDWLVASNSHSNSAFKTKSLPWHGINYPCSSEFEIFDPLSSSPNHLASRQIITWSDFGIQSPDYVYVIGIKHNWLILFLTKSNWSAWEGRLVLLFSPLTKRIITLPKFDYPNQFLFAATFSTHPDSQDCVFCLVDNYQVDKIHVLTYRYGDKEWTATQFDRHPDFLPSLFSFTPHIISGILYFVSLFGGLVGSYNILNGEFNFDCLPLDQFVVRNCRCKHVISFVLNGELMILCYDRDVKKDDACIRGQQFIKRYDRLSKVWIPVTTLADYALFFDTRFTNVSLINTKDDTTCNGVLPNKVYHFFSGGCLVYSLEDGRLVPFKSINSNLLEDGGDNLPEYKYNYVHPETQYAFWLEAPCVRSSSDNQEVRSFRDEGKQGSTSLSSRAEVRSFRDEGKQGSTCPWMTNQNFLVIKIGLLHNSIGILIFSLLFSVSLLTLLVGSMIFSLLYVLFLYVYVLFNFDCCSFQFLEW